MSELFSGLTRSQLMARIRSKGNKRTELVIVNILRAYGVTGWRRQIELRFKKYDLQGKAVTGAVRAFKVRPDFVWRRERVALFVDGCFWHGCPWHGTKPASNKAFWREKLAKNRARDRLVTRTLRKAGWRVVRVWEHTLPRAARDDRELEKLVARITTELYRGIHGIH